MRFKVRAPFLTEHFCIGIQGCGPFNQDRLDTPAEISSPFILALVGVRAVGTTAVSRWQAVLWCVLGGDQYKIMCSSKVERRANISMWGGILDFVFWCSLLGYILGNVSYTEGERRDILSVCALRRVTFFLFVPPSQVIAAVACVVRR